MFVGKIWAGRYICLVGPDNTTMDFKLRNTENLEEYLKESLKKIINFIGETEITFPRICAGLGGMNWEEVKSIFFSIDSPRVHLYLIENSAQKT